MYFSCPKFNDEESEFCTAKIFDENLLNARNEYRKKFGLLTSDEIIDIRKTYGLSQVELARLIGAGDVTIVRYETKAIQEQVYDNILRRIKNYPMEALELLNINKGKFSEERYNQISKIIIKININMELKWRLVNYYKMIMLIIQNPVQQTATKY